jgi:hypothetical protein
MARKTLLDKQIDQVDSEIAVLQNVRERLIRQRDEQLARKASKAADAGA